MDREPVAKEHGALYWFLHNTLGGLVGYFRRHRTGTIISSLLVLFMLFALRGIYHPYVIEVRKRSFLFVLVFGLLVMFVWARRRRTAVKIAAYAVSAAGLVAIYFWGNDVHDFMSLYNRYNTLQVVELSQLPVTCHERVQPLNSIYSLAHEKVATETESPQRPRFVRMGSEYRWTAAIEPAHFIPRFTGRVEEVLNIRDEPAPDFSSRERVEFHTGETMLLSHNSHTAALKTFGPWRFWNYEPIDVALFKDDGGKWVQVVTLIRWKGILFPRPEFGGVAVIRQESGGLLRTLSLMLFGAGEWIRPEDVKNHSFLVGQNILSYDVSRYIANSFRFQAGFMGPMPWNRQGDVRIPDLSADVNDQPFTACFTGIAARPEMLYHYFSLEPFDLEKQGLSISVLIPADGSGPVYAYKHSEHGSTLTGVSAIAAKVMNSRKEYDWSRNRPVEHRPFIRDILGKRRFLWLTTVVTYKEGTTATDINSAEKSEDPKWFIAGTLPSIVITDAETNIPVWVSLRPEDWINDLLGDRDVRQAWGVR